MGKMILCVGNYAKTPYYMKDSNLNLYSIEELCYFLCENVIFLDNDMMERELLNWIGEECGLQELAKTLFVCYKKKESLPVFVEKILENVHYCSEKERREIGSRIVESSFMNNWEKRKSRIDFYYQNGKYLTALKEYEQLRSELSGKEFLLKNKISHNIGVLYAKLYFFDKAAESFLEAYRDGGNTESYFLYLAAKRMSLGEEAYVDFVATKQEDTDTCLQLEQKLEVLDTLWTDSEENVHLQELCEWKSGKRAGEYYEAVEELIHSWEDIYRDNTLNL